MPNATDRMAERWSNSQARIAELEKDLHDTGLRVVDLERALIDTLALPHPEGRYADAVIELARKVLTECE